MPWVPVNHGVSQNGLPIDVRGARLDAVERGLVGIEQFALEVDQALILVAGLQDGAQPRLVGFELGGALHDTLFQRLVELPQLDLGLLGDGDVVGDADEADMLAGRVPARLRFRAQPAPFAGCVPVARLQHERFQRRFALDRLLQHMRQVVGMQHLAPVEGDGLVVRQADEVDIGLVGEGARAVELRDPDRHRRAVGDQPEALLALAQRLARERLGGDVDMGADEANGAAVAVALELGDNADPADLAVAGADDAVFGGVVFVRPGQRIEEVLDRGVAILGMDAVDPILMRLVGGIRRQPVEHQIFRRAAVLEAFAEVDLEAADLADALDTRQLCLALLERVIGVVALARDLFEVLAQPFGGGGIGQGIVQGVGRCDARAHVPGRYSHRQSVIAITQKGIRTERRHRSQGRVLTNARSGYLFPNVGTMSPPRAYLRGVATLNHKLPSRRG